MKARVFFPEKLDVAGFIDDQAELSGVVPVSSMPRLAESLAAEAQADALQVSWSMRGWLEPQRAGQPHRWLAIEAHAELPWTCQRCLTPVILPLQVERSIRWVADEAAAAALDAELDDDVLALVRQLDALSLIEDELIMEAPLVPRHDECPVQVIMSTDELAGSDADPASQGAESDEATARENPFAVLAKLKKTP